MTINRRQFIGMGGATMAMASLGGLTSALTSFPIHAANTGGYKALVCVFLYGGMDNHDTVIPYDINSYQRWAQIRSSLVYAQGSSRQRSSLLPLEMADNSSFGSRQFALPPEFAGLHQLFQSGNAAVVGNVGPIIEPTTAALIEAETVRVPSRLFSHNDQQATWMAGEPEGAQYGWGGLFADAMANAGANSNGNTFSTITTGGVNLLITGRDTSPYQLVDGGALIPELLEYTEGSLAQRLRRHFRAEAYQGNSLLGKDMAAKIQRSFDANALYATAASTSFEVNTTFPQSELGNQLEAVAKSIAVRNQLGTERQIFVVAMGGFDTHSAQAQNLPMLQTQIDQAVVAFHTSLQELGLVNDVTLFTASDFGRTLAINGDGTDHGWGGHHFVVGGAVQGGTIYGGIPEADFGHSLDAGSGRLIPTMSVEQYAGSLGTWFGLGENELAGIFPNINAMGQTPDFFV